MSSSGTLTLDVSGGIGILRIQREAKRNALDSAMVSALGELCREIEHREDIDVLIVTGTGAAFCAGGDIEAWSGNSALQFARHWVRDGHDSFDRLARLRQPVIAAINGHVLGGGLELAACADYRIAEKQVKVGQPEAGLGIIPGWSGTQRAVRRFGAQLVRRMALFGEVLSAEQARAEGIVDQVVAQGQSVESAIKLAETLRNRGGLAAELTKMLINAAEGEESERILEALAGHIAAASEELSEGLSAFREKRRPSFKKGSDT